VNTVLKINAPAATQARDRLMLVRLSISAWSPRKFDRKASDELARLHGAANANEIGRFNKLLIDLDSIKPLQKALGDVRHTHYSMTAPWSDDGVRILPVDMYFKYTETVRAAKSKVEQLAHEFATVDYARERETARTRLAGLFNASDYPMAMEVESRFGVRVAFEPLPNAADVRLWSLGQEAVEEIQSDVERSVRETLAASQRHVVEQVKQRAGEFVEKVRRFDTGDTTGLRETAVENLRDVVRTVLDGLNVTGDPALTQAAQELDSALQNVIVDRLRHNKNLRLGKIDEVEAITRKFAGVFGGVR
jgi:hypothetical protein